MTVDAAVVPGLLSLALELLALAAVGYVVARVALRQTDVPLALAQGLVIGPAFWGLIVNFVLYLLPGMAGAVAGWVVLLTIGVRLAWNAPARLRLPSRTLAGFVAAALALAWIALAGRQLLTIPDFKIHLGLSSAIRAGIHPPELPWNPGAAVPYHYGVDLLIGLLMPPSGPDWGLTTEVLGAYLWTSLALVAITTLRSHGSWFSALILSPLLLTAGTWTLVLGDTPALLKLPVTTGLPSAGLRAAVTDVYWPTLNLPSDWAPYFETPPPNIWTPPFVLSYALAIVVLERIAVHREQHWPARASLAFLVGFLGLVEETVALTVLGIWVVLASHSLVDSTSRRLVSTPVIWRTASGPALALLLLAIGGGPLTGVLTGGLGGSLSLGEPRDVVESRMLTTVHPLAGGIGLLGLGAIPVAAGAIVLGWRKRLVLALALGSGVFIFAALTLRFSTFQFDVGRLDGHARNFALLALLVALSIRLHALRPGWRYAAAGCLVVLMVWPTIATPVQKVRLALNRGIELANARPTPSTDFVASLQHMGRLVPEPFATASFAAHIRSHTRADARILSPSPIELSIQTGRSSASGFTGHVHLFPFTGPDYEDAIRFLDPAAARRLEFDYVHATESWISSLPARANTWLADSTLFTPVVRDGTHTLFRVKPAFLAMEAVPDPRSFEALRLAVPASAKVLMSAGIQTIPALRLAAALSQAKLSGSISPSNLYLLTEIPISPSGDSPPDVVVVARDRAMNASAHAFPAIWWNETAIAFASSSAVDATVDPPPEPESNFVIQISDVHQISNRIAFTATFIDQAPTQWTGQDWLVIAVNPDPWSLPTAYEPDGYTLVGARWFAGQIVPSSQSTNHSYEFNGDTQQLALLRADGSRRALQTSGDHLAPGTYVLAVRLRQDHLQAGIIPILKMTVSEDGRTSYKTLPGDHGTTVNACPERMQNTESCRQMAANS